MPESDNSELSMDELKDVSGAGMGLDRLGTQYKGKKTNLKGDRVHPGVADSSSSQLKGDEVVWIPGDNEPGKR